jgi:hypothetical protein
MSSLQMASEVRIDVPDEVVGVELDPNHKVLLWRPDYGAPPTVTH